MASVPISTVALAESLGSEEIVGFAVVVIFYVLVVGAIVLFIRNRLHASRKQEEFEEFVQKQGEEADASKSAKAATQLWLEIKASYPFLETPQIEDPTFKTIMSAVGDELYRDGTLGEGDAGVPVPILPVPARMQHLYVIGKTGSGKSTYLEHQIVRDIQNGWGVGVIGPEGEFFSERILPLIPRDRWDEVVYFAPGDPQCPHTLNPLALTSDEDPLRASEDLFTILRRTFAEEELGPRMGPLLQNALQTLVGRPGMTLWHVKQLLEDADFRNQVVATTDDEYTRSFWEGHYLGLPKAAHLPILNRLDRFLRPPEIRRILCSPSSTFSIREILSSGRIFLVNLFGLSQENRELFGQVILSKFQLELMRREVSGGSSHAPFLLYADEFQAFAGVAEGTWRELLSRGRKYKLGLTLAHQYPAQLSTALQDEILGNVHSIVAFALGGKDAQVIRREMLTPDVTKAELVPVSSSRLIDQPTGHALIRFAGGHATGVSFPGPLEADSSIAAALSARFWEGIHPTPPEEGFSPRVATRPAATESAWKEAEEPEKFSE